MFKQKIPLMALLIMSLILPLSGCSPAGDSSGKLTGENILQSHRAGASKKENVPAAPGKSHPEQAQSESKRIVSVISIPRAQVVESTSGRVYNPVNQPRYVYLTFDDGPNTNFTGRILDILAGQQVKASFMVVGLNAEENPGLLKRITGEGHAVINHTYTHNYKKIYASPEALLADLDRANQVLEKILGRPVKIFRPPGGPGYLNKSFRDKFKEKGYQSVGWNITGGDTNPQGVTPEQVYNNVAGGLAKVEKLQLTPIILLHDGTQLSTTGVPPDSSTGRYIQNRESAIAALPGIIELLKSKGYTFAAVDENTPLPW